MTKRLWNEEKFDEIIFKYNRQSPKLDDKFLLGIDEKQRKKLKSFIDSEFEKYQERLVEKIEKLKPEILSSEIGLPSARDEDRIKTQTLDDVIREIKDEA